MRLGRKLFLMYDFQTGSRNSMVVPTSPWLRSHTTRTRTSALRRESRPPANEPEVGEAMPIGFI